MDPTQHPTTDPTNYPTTYPIMDGANDPTAVESASQPTVNPPKDAEVEKSIEATTNPIQISTTVLVIVEPQIVNKVELYLYFGTGIVVLLICIIVLLILIYRRYYLQDAEAELTKNTKMDTHVEHSPDNNDEMINQITPQLPYDNGSV